MVEKQVAKMANQGRFRKSDPIMTPIKNDYQFEKVVFNIFDS